MSDKARLAAFNVIKRIFEGSYSNLVLPNHGLSGLDRAFAENIVLGTLERKVTLEFVLSKFVNRECSSDVSALIITGMYQILYMDRVPDSAACNETVIIAKDLFGQKVAGFVNGVLRNLCRKKDRILQDIDESAGFIKYSSNKDLFEMLESYYPERIEDIFNAFLGKPKTFLRVNTLKASSDEIARKTNGTVLSKSCVQTDETADVIAQLQNGEFYIQGRASQKAVELLDAKPNDVIVDVCACPGGKSLGAAIDMENKGRIYSLDLHVNKLSLINKSAKTLGIDIIETRQNDARHIIPELEGIADKVICDVPCSGTGVMGAKPEIKYKSPEDFKGLYKTQRDIIKESAKYLKIGGTMVYSTCSINKAENEDVLFGFLSEHDGFKLIYERTLLPFEEAHEGFYMAKIIREY